MVRNHLSPHHSSPNRRRLTGDAGELSVPVIIGAGIAIVLVVVVSIQVAYLTGVIDDEQRPRVLVLGDSISDRGQRSLRDEVAGAFEVSIDGKASFTTQMMVPAAQRWSTRDFEQVIINLGSNDIAQGVDVDQSALTLAQMVDLFPEAVCVHLVTVTEAMPEAAGPDVRRRAAELNERMRSLAAEDERVRIVDWAAIVRDEIAQGREPTLDGVHPTNETHPRLAAAQAESLDACHVDVA
jgi:hypothetical protein